MKPMFKEQNIKPFMKNLEQFIITQGMPRLSHGGKCNVQLGIHCWSNGCVSSLTVSNFNKSKYAEQISRSTSIKLLFRSRAKGTDLSEASSRTASAGTGAADVAFAVFPLTFRHP